VNISLRESDSSSVRLKGDVPASSPSLGLSASQGRQAAESDSFYTIANVDRMPPFFMSLVSADDHWMFIASNGAITCGRKCADRALFPYYCSDKLLDTASATGPKTILQLIVDGALVNWQPWSDHGWRFEVKRSVHKNRFSSRVCFAEENLTLGLTFEYQWAFSRRYGFVRRCQLRNTGSRCRSLRVLDGLVNVMPGGLDQQFQLQFSNLADAYKKSELHANGRMGVFYLASIPTDRAEPSEGLRATIVWTDLPEPRQILLSERQLNQFCSGQELMTESDVRGQRGAFLALRQVEVKPGATSSWFLAADVHQDHRDFTRLQRELVEMPDAQLALDADIDDHDLGLLKLISRVDGLQISQQVSRADRHLSNCMFNAMRGGVPIEGYVIDSRSLSQHIRGLNVEVWKRHRAWLMGLPARTHYLQMLNSARSLGDPDLSRICGEYLPLTFSRRHGDPTRPWNVFNIDVKNADGTCKLGYEGNWRDIFQNWEALGTAYPQFFPAMVRRFINASTADGYNPYRLTMTGFDWERVEPANAWANIGYWGDHQIVYLLKLLEHCHAHLPTELDRCLTDETFVYADVPYRIRDYAAIRSNPRVTIDYDHAEEKKIGDRVSRIGMDGQLLVDQQGRLHRANLLEKLLLTAAIKMTNWIPDAGIWLNTQRPEWNDAQNALVGNGASVITVCYLHRYLVFLRRWLDRLNLEEIRLSSELAQLLADLCGCLDSWRRRLEPGTVLSADLHSADLHSADLTAGADSRLTDRQRHRIVDQLQRLGEAYRRQVYSGPSGSKSLMEQTDIRLFIDSCIDALASTIDGNLRKDGLVHSYNLLAFEPDSIGLERLDEMLEGQVAAIESGLLEPEVVVRLLDSLRQSRLYRPDQRSYTLVPDRILPRFDERNLVEKSEAESIPLVKLLIQHQPNRILYRDAAGCYRFAADLRNAKDLRDELDRMEAPLDISPLESCHSHEEFRQLLASNRERLLALYERTFRHRHFTGRSNTFAAYEGLGSIYWHMVSKLSLAVCRQWVQESKNTESPYAARLREQFREINNGIWFDKSPAVYGAFPTDPYSHTPLHAGAQQPGMTGQVKEDILIRQLELGIRIEQGTVRFDPSLIDDPEWLETAQVFRYFDRDGVERSMVVQSGWLAFTLCQVPISVGRGESTGIRIFLSNHQIIDRPKCELSPEESRSLFDRDGRIVKIEIVWKEK
jgi:hypothetical protein